MREIPFYRLATLGWANPLLRQTTPLLSSNLTDEIVVDLSRIEFIDSFGITYLAACIHRCMEAAEKVFVRPPAQDEVNNYLQDVGLYEAIGLSDRFRPRKPKSNRVDLKHITDFQPSVVDDLLDLLERMQPFAPGLRASMRMSLFELLQNFIEHSSSEAGAWISGQKYRSRITVCVLDLGKGIPAALRTVKKYRRFGDPKLVELATEEGVSSVPGTARGLGLNTIRRFVRFNGGTLTLISREGRVRFPPDRRPLRDTIAAPFPGTAAVLSLVPNRRGLFAL